MGFENLLFYDINRTLKINQLVFPSQLFSTNYGFENRHLLFFIFIISDFSYNKYSFLL